ncbi:MAG: CopG family transcriptional regulator [Myxococcales bacterium]|nr:CopG family transcriptional regulator [Myxococcales bacterium]
MPTTIHVPRQLLVRVDARAKALGVSRNRVILAAIEGAIEGKLTWPAELISQLAEPLDPEAGRAFERSLQAVRRKRSHRRRPPVI